VTGITDSELSLINALPREAELKVIV